MQPMDDLVITTLAERPELIDRVYDMEDSWPDFYFGEALSNALLHRVAGDFPEYCAMATTSDGTPVARAHCVPFQFGTERRTELPDRGWDGVLTWAYNDREWKRPVNMAGALEVMITPALAGKGLSYRMLGAMRAAVAAQGISTLVAPVRPSQKQEQHAVRMPMADYARLVRDDGLPQDPWLRVHARLGAVIVKVAPVSMVVSGSLAEWRQWTGLPLDHDGEVIVPGALVPVSVSLAHDRAVYVEPNLWMRHDLGSLT
jgi:hypothetical protein